MIDGRRITTPQPAPTSQSTHTVGFYECIGDPTCLHNAGHEGARCPIHRDLQRIAFAARTTPEGNQ